MSEYRDDLGAAHVRIAQLEYDLAAARKTEPPEKPRRKRLRLPTAGLLFAVTLAVGTLEVCTHLHQHCERGTVHEPAHFDRTPLPTPPSTAATKTPSDGKNAERPRAPLIHASWYSQPGVVPTAVDVRGDGRRYDLVGLFWRTEGLHVVSIDGVTFTPRWVAGPITMRRDGAPARLAVVDGQVIVSDGQRALRAFSASTGEKLAERQLPANIVDLCAAPRQENLALVRTPQTAGYFVPSDTSLRVAPSDLRCPTLPARCEKTPGSCFYVGLPQWAAFSTFSSLETWRTYTDGDAFVAVGLPYDNRGRTEVRAAGVARGAKTPTWERSLIFSIDRLNRGQLRHDMRDGRLVSLYETTEGLWRVIAHDAATGVEQWYGVVPHSGDAVHMTALAIEGPYVLVAADEAVHVYDATSGRYLRSLDASTL